MRGDPAFSHQLQSCFPVGRQPMHSPTGAEPKLPGAKGGWGARATPACSSLTLSPVHRPPLATRGLSPPGSGRSWARQRPPAIPHRTLSALGDCRLVSSLKMVNDHSTLGFPLIAPNESVLRAAQSATSPSRESPFFSELCWDPFGGPCAPATHTLR